MVATTTAGLAGVRDQKDAAKAAEIDYSADFDRLNAVFQTRKTFSYEWREKQLKGIEKMMIDHADEIMATVKKDIGRHPTEAFLGDVTPGIAAARHALANLKKWMEPEHVVHPMQLKPGSSMLVPQPKGVVLVIGAWNFPLTLTLGPLVAAIAAGCCAIIKPSEVSPGCAELTARLLPQYIDQDCFKIVNGSVPETTALLRLPFNHIFYTGNSAVAHIVMEAAAKHLTPVTLELGGKSPVIIDRDADIEVAVRRILHGKFFNAGQICIAPDYVLCHKDMQDKVTRQMQATLKKMFGEDPRQSDSYGRIINTRHWDRVTSLLKDTGGTMIAGGLDKADRESKYIPPTIVTGVDTASRLMREEIFGPVLPIIPVNSTKDAVDLINSKDTPLALYVFSKNRKAVDDIIRDTSSGTVLMNDVVFQYSNPELPFGGVGPSGMGAYHGKAGFDEFTHHRPVMIRGTWLDPSKRYPPYDAKQLPMLKKIMIGPLFNPTYVRAVKVLAVAVVALMVYSKRSVFGL